MGMMGNPNFAKWFGKSVVKDAAGEPLRVYHGTDMTFEAFDRGMSGKNFGKDVGYRKGFFFADNPAGADVTQFDIPLSGNPQTIPAYLSLQNPLQVNIKNGQRIKGHWSTFDDPESYYDNAARMINKKASSAGKDGIVVTNTDTGESMYVAFKPGQIKSPFNQGAFDPTNPNILKGVGAGLGLMGAASAISPERANAEALQEPIFDPTTLLAGPARWGGGLMNMGVDAAMRYFTGGK